jgi:hypothetical protein
MKTEAYCVWIIRLFKLVMLLVSGRGGTTSILRAGALPRAALGKSYPTESGAR